MKQAVSEKFAFPNITNDRNQQFSPLNSKAGLAADPDFRVTYEDWTLLHRTRKPEDIVYCALWYHHERNRIWIYNL